MTKRKLFRSIIGGMIGALFVLVAFGGVHWAATLAWLGGPLGLASWVQAIGSVAAVAGALWIALNANAVQRRRDAEARTAVITAAYMMIHGVQNIAAKSGASLKRDETVAFWKLEGGGFIQDLYDQMNRLPIHESGDLMVMGAFENARAMLNVMSKMHRTIAAADENLGGYAEYVVRTTAGIEAMEKRCGILATAVATKLPQVPRSDEALFSKAELDPIFGPDR